MKLKINKTLKNLFIASVVFFIMTAVLARTSDANQPIVIDSLKHFLDIQNNISIFSDNVIIKQGTINIHANKVLATYPHHDQKKTYIEAFGNPVTFYQLQDNGKPITGYANKIHYDLATQFVTLTGDACLGQWDNHVKSDLITYLVKQQKLQAFSNKGKRVITVLVPSQLQNKK
ncbi:lipopolysaccharide ABC transporter substrate-binding protein LptA [Candidatus Gillettellia adelgis]